MQQHLTGENLTVVSVGLGEAGGNPDKQHGVFWSNYLPAAGCDVTHIGYDSDPLRRAAAADSIGTLSVIHSLECLPDALDGMDIGVLDITTSSGHHASALEDTLVSLANADLAMPAVIAIEKPFVSNADERRQMRDILAYYEVGASTIGLEHYLNNPALLRAADILRGERARGNDIASIIIDFSKNRVPDVRHGRFQDNPHIPTMLASFGIEPPHMLAIANKLLGSRIDTYPQDRAGDVMESRLFHDVFGVKGSEGAYVKAMHGDTVVVMKQALGPFSIHSKGMLQPHKWSKAFRNAKVTLQDGRSLTLAFDPIPGGPAHHCRLDYVDPSGEKQLYIEPDLSHPNTLQAVARFALTGNRPKLLNGMGHQSALRASTDLLRLRAIAGLSMRVM